MPPITIYYSQEHNRQERQARLMRCARAAARQRGLRPLDLRLEKAARGKPYFPALPQLQFSISHSGAYWLAAFGGQPLGLDLQAHQPRDYQPIAHRWYHPWEQAHLQTRGLEDFYEIWSAKESVIKQSGQGLAQGLPQFSVIDANGQFRAQMEGGLWLRRLPFEAGYSLCLCTPEDAPVVLQPLPEA